MTVADSLFEFGRVKYNEKLELLQQKNCSDFNLSSVNVWYRNKKAYAFL